MELMLCLWIESEREQERQFINKGFLPARIKKMKNASQFWTVCQKICHQKKCNLNDNILAKTISTHPAEINLNLRSSLHRNYYDQRLKLTHLCEGPPQKVLFVCLLIDQNFHNFTKFWTMEVFLKIFFHFSLSFQPISKEIADVQKNL